MKRACTMVPACWVLLVPGLADACPMCVSQQPGGVARLVALGAMLLLPFSVVVVVFRSLRRSCGITTEERSTERGEADLGTERLDGMREPSR